MESILQHFDYAVAIGWVAGRLGQILLLVAIGLVLRAMARRVVPRLIKTAVLKSSPGGEVTELAKRYHTLGVVVTRSLESVMWVIIAFMMLAQLSIDISPILAGVGVVGIAIGFGAQTLVKDMLAGMFILLDNQYGKGDVVTIAGVTGQVEEVNLRRTVLRDQDGTVHSIPNGEVRVASNLTREWSRVNMRITIAYGDDIDRAMSVIDRTGQELAADPAFGPCILQAPKSLRIDEFDQHGVVVKILGVTKPGCQWEVAGELRRRLKTAFEESGVVLAFAQPALIGATGGVAAQRQ